MVAVASPSFTFQLFIYESLSIQYHYSIKRTRDVRIHKNIRVERILEGAAPFVVLYYYNKTNHLTLKRFALKVFKVCLSREACRRHSDFLHLPRLLLSVNGEAGGERVAGDGGVVE